jgi:hypothetical protein
MAYNTPASASTSHLRANQLCFRTHSTSGCVFLWYQMTSEILTSVFILTLLAVVCSCVTR